MSPPPLSPPSPPDEDRRPGDDDLRLLAAQAVAAVRGEALPAGGDPRSTERVRTVVRAILDARDPRRGPAGSAG